MKKELIIHFISFLFLSLLSIFLGIDFFISGLFSFLMSLAIIKLSFNAYQNRVFKELHSGKFDDLEGKFEEDESDERKKAIYPTTFFSFYKIIAYAVLAFGLFILSKFGLLNMIAIFVGIFLTQIGVLIYGYFIKSNLEDV